MQRLSAGFRYIHLSFGWARQRCFDYADLINDNLPLWRGWETDPDPLLRTDGSAHEWSEPTTMICLNPFNTVYVQTHAYATCFPLRELAMRLPNDSVITMRVALRGVRDWAVGITNEKARNLPPQQIPIASEGGQEV